MIAKNTQNKKLLELMGVANEQLKRTDKSVGNFNDLFKTTNDYIYLYKISAIYFDNQMFAKADSLTDILIQKADTSKRIMINLPDGTSQSVPILAACYNMKGAILAEGSNNIQGAIPYFQKALKIDPEFAFPRLYLERISQYLQQGR